MLRAIAGFCCWCFVSVALAGEGADYADPTMWLCHPEHPNLCEQDLSSSVVEADGSVRVERFSKADNPLIDCFYVYPTVSLDESGNSDWVPNREEARVIQVQFARFGSVCRTFAPIYRQITLTALRARIAGETIDLDPQLGYRDVKAAWQHYLATENQGRGVVLIGHSQGSGMLTQLIRAEIDGQPMQQRLVAAYLIGSAAVLNPPDQDVGGTFKHLPLCRRAEQTQCVVSFASFRENLPPPPNARFGLARDPQQRHLRTACNLPGALAGGAAPLQAYLSATGENLASSSSQAAWSTLQPDLQTPFVTAPGLLEAECVSHDGFSYLAVRVNGDTADPRADDIAGDVIIGEEIAQDWGLHLIDMHLAMGNMVALVKAQATAYAGKPNLD